MPSPLDITLFITGRRRNAMTQIDEGGTIFEQRVLLTSSENVFDGFNSGSDSRTDRVLVRDAFAIEHTVGQRHAIAQCREIVESHIVLALDIEG